MIGWDSRTSVDSVRITRIILILVFLIQLTGIFDHSLWPPDEPRVAEIAREMSITGNYLIPHFSLKPVLEHPFLYYATSAVFYRIMGTSLDGVGRIASLLFALGTLLTVFTGMRRIATGRAAGLATIILATCFSFFLTSHKMLVDNALCFCITLALFAFLHGYLKPESHGFKLFWLALILAFLAKGFLGLGIIAVSLILFLLRQADFKVIRRAWFLPGILLLCAVISLWSWLLYAQGGKTFLRIFFLNNQLLRFFGNPFEGIYLQGFSYYLKNFWINAAPWSLLFIPALIFGRSPDISRRFFLMWFWGGLILLCFLSIKREFYFIHLLPAMACVISLWLEKLLQEPASRTEKIFLALMGVQLMLILIGLPLYFFLKLRGTLFLSVLLLACSLAAVWFLYVKHGLGCFYTAIFSCALFYLLWTPPIFSQLDQYRSYKDVFIRIGQLVSDKPVTGYHLSDTAEALSAFYGGFYVDHIRSRRQFESILQAGKPMYVMIIPWRIDANLFSTISAYADVAVADDFRNPKNIEVWEVAPSLLYPLPEIETGLPFQSFFYENPNTVEP